MGKSHVFSLLVSLLLLLQGSLVRAVRTDDGSESWGYVEVRPKAHMFWWYYRSPHRTEDPNKPWPIILWLQGGPGASGVGIGNFEEIGPLDTYLKPRNSTWLAKADLLFVDNPVGTGYSFVEDLELLVKTDYEAADDLTTLLIEIFNRNETLQKSPLYIVAESYGGKYAVTLGLTALRAIEAGRLKLKLGGIALGDTWISPEDFVFSWGPLLKDVSRLDNNGLKKSNSIAEQIKQELETGKFVEATESWSHLEDVISSSSNSVDFYNFLLDSGMDPVSLSASELSQQISIRRYSRYLNSLRRDTPGGDGDINTLMNIVMKKKLKIPKNVEWGGQSGPVFAALEGDFMKPRIHEVDELLAKGVNLTIYSGQLDVICSTKGTEAWVAKLKWDGLKTFLGMERMFMLLYTLCIRLILLFHILRLLFSQLRDVSVLLWIHFWDAIYMYLLFLNRFWVRVVRDSLGQTEAVHLMCLHVFTYPIPCALRLHCTRVLFSPLVMGFLMRPATFASLRGCVRVGVFYRFLRLSESLFGLCVLAYRSFFAPPHVLFPWKFGCIPLGYA